MQNSEEIEVSPEMEQVTGNTQHDCDCDRMQGEDGVHDEL